MKLNLDEENPAPGYTQAQWEMMRLQLKSPGQRRTLPAPRIVEFCCEGTKGGGGHLLAVIYRTRKGPLAVSTADTTYDREDQDWLNRQARELIREDPRLFREDPSWNPKQNPWAPNPRLLEVDEPFADDPVSINCRCGSWPDLTRDHFRSALRLSAQSERSPLIVGVSNTMLHSAAGTLCMF